MGLWIPKSHLLLDALMDEFNLKNDAALASALGVSKPLISKVRNRVLPLRASLVLRIHDATGWPIKQIKELGA